MNIIKIFLLLAIIWQTSAPFAAPNNSGMVSVGPNGTLGVGFVADKHGTIIANMDNTDDGQPIQITTADGSTWKANIIGYEEKHQLSLLKIVSNAAALSTLKPYTFARDPAQAQRLIFAIKPDPLQSQTVTGTLSSIRQAQSTELPDYYLHNALVGKDGVGGPLFNNCNEVVGVIVAQPDKRWFKADVKETAYAVPTQWLAVQFNSSTSGTLLQPKKATNPCLSVIAQKEKQAEAAKKQTEDAKKQTEDAKKRAEAAKKQAEVDKKAELEAAKRKADEEIAAVKLQSEAANQAKLKEYSKWAVISAAVLLPLLLLLWILRQRSTKRANLAQSSLDARQQDDALIAAVPNVFIDGKDAQGHSVAVRIPKASIAKRGAIVGRNPKDSDFVINHPLVSRKQFRLFASGKTLMIEDLGSTNGTTVDGKRLNAGDSTTITNLSRIELGSLKLSARFEMG